MQVKYDLFPAFVAVLPASDTTTPPEDLRSAPNTPGSRQIQTARVVVSDTRITIAIDGNSGPLVVFSEGYTEGNFHKSAKRSEDSYLITTSGKKLAFRKDENCGCGSRLKSWRPSNISDSVRDPKA